MCRNIKILYNFDPPVTDEEVRAASLQFVRKISGFNKPSKANEVALSWPLSMKSRPPRHASSALALETHAPHRTREEEAAKAKARGMQRFGT